MKNEKGIAPTDIAPTDLQSVGECFQRIANPLERVVG